MKRYKSPLGKSIFFGCILFLTLLGLTIATVDYSIHKNMTYRDCETQIGDILRYTAGKIDVDDLETCIETGEESEKFRQLQRDLDEIRASISMHFLYCVVPLNTDETDNMKNVIAAVSAYEYENMADELVHLNQLTGDAYSPATAEKYLTAYKSGQLNFFEEVSQWGDDYTGLLPLYDSAGNKVAALCMDLDVRQINRSLTVHFWHDVAIILVIGACAAAFFVYWSRRFITQPIEQLERCLSNFAAYRDPDHPDAVQLQVPKIERDNEIASLARAMQQLGEDMNGYMQNVLTAEQKLNWMTVMAHKDALTRVGNATAFVQQSAELNEQIAKEPVPFAVVMADVNGLKTINDTYGHNYGDLYIKGCCMMLCYIFHHSPVFRIGGDEFVVLLTGSDYDDRQPLLARAQAQFRQKQNDMSVKAWERLSMALGMAESTGAAEETVASILAQADKNMYRAKSEMKKGA